MSTIQVPVPEFHLLLGYEDWAQAENGATATANSTADESGEDLIDLTADKIVTQELDSSWRSGSLADFFAVEVTPVIQVTIDLGQGRPVDYIAQLRHNIRVPYRVELFRNAPAPGVVAENADEFADDTWFDPVVRAALSDFGWLDLPWNLGPSTRRLDALQSLLRLDSPYLCARTYYGIRYVRISYLLEEGANEGADYLQLTHVMVGRKFRPAVNMLIDWAIQPVDRSEVRRVESGAKRGRRRSRPRTFLFALGYLTRKEAFTRILSDMLLEVGVLGLVFAWPEPAHRIHYYEQALVGQMNEGLASVAMAQLEVPAARGFVIEEAE